MESTVIQWINKNANTLEHSRFSGCPYVLVPILDVPSCLYFGKREFLAEWLRDSLEGNLTEFPQFIPSVVKRIPEKCMAEIDHGQADKIMRHIKQILQFVEEDLIIILL